MSGNLAAPGKRRQAGMRGPGAILRDIASSLWLTAPMEFTLHPRLAAGSHDIGRLAGCRLLLKDQALFPWFLLVPEVEASLEDLHQLDATRYAEVMQAVRELSQFVCHHFQPEKLNVACIGNQVRQMHLHVVARFEHDAAWPGTVWAHPGKTAYEPAAARAIVEAARSSLPLE